MRPFLWLQSPLFRLSHQRFSLSSSELELFWFSSGFPFLLPLCSHRSELPLLRHDVTVYITDFLPNGAHNNNNNNGGIKLNNDFSNLIFFSRVPWFIVY